MDCELFGSLVPVSEFLARSANIADLMVQKISVLRKNRDLKLAKSTNAMQHVQKHFSSALAAQRLQEIIAEVTSENCARIRQACSAEHNWEGKPRFGPLCDFLPEMRLVRLSDFDCRPIYSTQLDAGSVNILSNGRTSIAAMKGTHLDYRAFSFLSHVDGLLPADKFSPLRFPSTWWEAVDAAFDMVLSRRPLAMETVRIPHLTRSIVSRLNRFPRVKQLLVKLGVHRIAVLFGYGRI
jgi:hypothetical protein